MGLVRKLFLYSLLFCLGVPTVSQAGWLSWLLSFSQPSSTLAHGKRNSGAILCVLAAGGLAYIGWKLWKKNNAFHAQPIHERQKAVGAQRTEPVPGRVAKGVQVEQEGNQYVARTQAHIRLAQAATQTDPEIKRIRAKKIKLKRIVKRKNAATQTSALEIAIQNGDKELIYSSIIQGEELDKDRVDKALELYRDKIRGIKNSIPRLHARQQLHFSQADVELMKESEYLLKNVRRTIKSARLARDQAVAEELQVDLPLMPKPLIKTIAEYSCAIPAAR